MNEIIKNTNLFKIALQKTNNIIPCETHTLIVESQKRGNDLLLLFFGMGRGINDFIRHSDYDSIEKTYLFLKRHAPYIRNSSSPYDFFNYSEDIKSKLLKFLPPVFSLMVKPVTLWNERIGILLNINKKDGSGFFDKDIELISATTEITGIATENIIPPNEESVKSDICNSNIDRDMVQNIHSDKIASLKRIAGGIAHTMNSPLTGVVTNLGMINPAEEIFRNKINEILKICKSHIQDQKTVNLIKLKIKKLNELECRRNKWRKTAEKGGKICKNIIEELMLFSKESSLEDCIYFNLNSRIKKIIKAVEKQFSAYNVIIEKNISDSPIMINGNVGEICHAFFNILSNAFQSINKKPGKIFVSTSFDGDKYASVIIQDNGSGIINDVKEEIFDPFFTTNKSTERKGLGLSISQTLIEKHGGIIDFVSSPDEGATFIIKLPAHQIN